MTQHDHPNVRRLSLRGESDVAAARRAVRELAIEQEFEHTAAEALATAVTEIARNVIVHASRGELTLEPLKADSRLGILVVTRDWGPGISDIEGAMSDGHSTGSGLGIGLPSARRLVDEFELATSSEGTTVTLRKWQTATNRHERES